MNAFSGENHHVGLFSDNVSQGLSEGDHAPQDRCADKRTDIPLPLDLQSVAMNRYIDDLLGKWHG